MEINQKLIMPVTETKYLTAENVDRYRSIIRLFYLNYEKLKYWMYQEEVYEALKKNKYFSQYTIEQCQQDLTALASWKNLLTIQDTRKATTIDEFKNKKFRYQLSEYTVEIERMVIRLENLSIEGASLEPTLLERIRINLAKLDEVFRYSSDQMYGWWKDLNNDFIRLNQNYQDYMRALNSVKAEEMMKTKDFLLFKDRLIEYLRSFVKSLQLNVTTIEQILKNVDEQYISGILENVTVYELSIPRMDMEVTTEQIQEKNEGCWESIRNWFIGKGSMSSEALKVFDTTNEIIRKITRYAARISEQSNSGANRREEYYKLATIFGKCSGIREAHQLSANVFGIEKPIHLKGEFARQTDSINSGVFDEKPVLITITPRVRNYKEKAQRSGIIDRTKEKEATKETAFQRIREEREMLQSHIQGKRLDFAKLPILEPHTRDIFLGWLSKAFESKQFSAKTEDGLNYYIEDSNPKARCVISCTDGNFTMPAYSIIFEEK